MSSTAQREAQPGALKRLSPGAERVLELARKRGPRGVHQTDFDAPGRTADGGKPIRRLAARVDELRNHGHVLEADRQRDRTVRYRLVRDAATVALALRGTSVDAAADAEPEPLFAPVPAPLNAALTDWEEGA